MVFGAVALMHEHGGVAAVVEDHVGRAAAVPFEQLGGVVPVVLQALALDREYRNAGGRDRGGGVVLRRIDVARHPAHVGAERGERLDQHRGLDGHVQRAGDAGALQGLLRAVLFAGRHQPGHFGFGERDFLAAEIGERDVLDDVVAGGSLACGGSGHDGPMQLTKWGGIGRAYNRPAAPSQRIYKDFFMSFCDAGRQFRVCGAVALAAACRGAAGGFCRSTPAWVRAAATCCMRLMRSTAAPGGSTSRQAG